MNGPRDRVVDACKSVAVAPTDHNLAEVFNAVWDWPVQDVPGPCLDGRLNPSWTIRRMLTSLAERWEGDEADGHPRPRR